jgi:hypothetical protein
MAADLRPVALGVQAAPDRCDALLGVDHCAVAQPPDPHREALAPVEGGQPLFALGAGGGLHHRDGP